MARWWSVLLTFVEMENSSGFPEAVSSYIFRQTPYLCGLEWLRGYRIGPSRRHADFTAGESEENFLKTIEIEGDPDE